MKIRRVGSSPTRSTKYTMRKLIIFAVLVIGMMTTAQAQTTEDIKMPLKDGQVFTIGKTNGTFVKEVLVTKGDIKVTKVKEVKKGRDTYLHATLETGTILVFKNGVLIGGIK